MPKIIVNESHFGVAQEIHLKIPELNGSPLEKTDFERRVKDADHLVLTAKKDDRHAGYMIGYNRYGHGSMYCWMTGVVPIARKEGVLSRMMEYLESWAKERNYTHLTVKTLNDHKSMLAYLVKNGFDVIDIDHNRDTSKIGILMEREIR
tara:strand:+ start:111 stop:557 length:447 start_codon:yes stop_codon:yes gene_type:complete